MGEEQDDKTIEDYVSDSSPDTETQETEQETEETEQVETPETSEEDETSGLSEGLKKRFSKMTADKHRLKSANEGLEGENAELKAKIQGYETKGPERPVKPKIDDESIDWNEDKLEEAKDQYFEDLADWKAQQRLGEFEQKGAVEKVKAQKQTLEEQHRERVNSSGIEDYEDKLTGLINAFEKEQTPVPAYLIESIQMDENGPKLVEYFSSNPDKAINIAKMGIVQAALEIGKLSAKVSNGKPVQTTKAPKPVQPVKGSGSRVKDKSNWSVNDYITKDLGD